MDEEKYIFYKHQSFFKYKYVVMCTYNTNVITNKSIWYN
jgi:hypothetical protein